MSTHGSSSVSVYNRSLLLDMVTESTTLSQSSRVSKASTKKGKAVPKKFRTRSITDPSNSQLSPSASKSKAELAELKRSRLITQRSNMLQEVEKEISRRKADAEERIRQHRIKKEEQFQRNWHELTASEGRQLHEEWGRKLDLHDREKQLKSHRLHTEWSEKIFEPIQRKIKARVSRLQEDGIHEIRQEEYQKFLSAVNEKGGLFLDTVDEAEYNPYVPNEHIPVVKTNTHDDPTLKVFTKAKEEMSMVPGSGNAPSHKAKDARYMLEVNLWGTGVIESTPHGHFAKMLDKDEGGRTLPKNAATSRTLKPGYVNHFNVPTGKEVMDKEWKAVNGKGVGMNARPGDTLEIK